MAIESLQANQGIYKALSKLTGKDYYKTKTGVLIKTDKGKGSVSYDTKTGEITCEGLENALITGTAKADKINIVDCKNIKATGGLGNDEFTVKYSDTVQINGGLGKDQVTLYDNPLNVKLKNVEKEINVTTPPVPEPTIPEPEPTVPKAPERDGVIDGFKQGDITDSKFFSQLISMSQTEEGAKIIKESIVWDDENRQATVHCKGLGVDVTVSYDKLQYEKDNGITTFYWTPERGDYEEKSSYSSGDDDVFLLEYVMKKLERVSVVEDKPPVIFKCTDSSGALNPYTFLAGVKYDNNYLTDTNQIEEVLNNLASDSGEKLISSVKPKSTDEIEVTDTNGKTVALDPNQTYAIKEVKNGLVTIVNPKDSTYNSQYTQTFTYSEFAKYFNITNPTDISKVSNISLEIQILEDSVLSQLSDLGISITTAKIVKPERNGVIEWSEQGGIGDCWFLTELNAMSYTEEGRRIIKEAIVWDDENRQAIVHCKGLGIDMVISYDELKKAEDEGSQLYYDEKYIGGTYSSGDDDMFLLEYAMAKLSYLENNKIIDFESIGIRPSPFEFLAGAKSQHYINDEAEIKDFLEKMKEDNGKNLVAGVMLNHDKIKDAGLEIVNFFFEQVFMTDVNGKEAGVALNHAYAIKEVKDGLVTITNPWDSSEDSKFTQTFTYDDFCKYFSIYNSADLSKTTDKISVMNVKEGVNLSDYGITLTSGRMIDYERNGEIEWSKRDSEYSDVLNQIKAMSQSEVGAQIIKNSIVWDDENRQATVHCRGLGIDITISYDELEREMLDSVGDEDVFLLQQVVYKLNDMKYFMNIECADSNGINNPYTFLAGVKYDSKYISDEDEIKGVLDNLESDGGQNLVVNASLKIGTSIEATDVNGKTTIFKPLNAYAIKEVKNGFVTVLNMEDATYNSEYAQTFSYNDFCKYFDLTCLADLSKPSDEIHEITIQDGVNLSDYNITVISGLGTVKICEFKTTDERILNGSTKTEQCTFAPGGVGSYGVNIREKRYKHGRLVNEIQLGETTEPSQTIDIAKSALNSKNKLNAFKYTDKDGVVHTYVNDNGNIRCFVGDNSGVLGYKLVEEKQMSSDEFKSYLNSILDSQEYITGYSVYADYEESQNQTIASAQDEITSNAENEAISEPIEVTITNLIPDSNPAPPPEAEVVFTPEPTEAEHTILDAGLDMKKSERKGTLTFEQQTPEPEPAEAPQKTTFKTISGSFLKTTGKLNKK